MAFLPSQLRESPLPDVESGVLPTGGRWLDLGIATMLLVLMFVIYFGIQDTIAITDSMWTVHVAMSMVKEGDIDLDEYTEIIARRNNFGVLQLDGHLHYFFPWGTPFMAVPFVFAADVFAERVQSMSLYEHLKTTYDSVVQRIELSIASLIGALTCVVVYFTGRLFLSRGQSLLLVFIAAFCTSVWSTTSRGLWQHGPSILMLSTALYLILAAEKKPWLVQFASIPLAYSWVIRPTNSISIAILSIYVLIRFRKYFVQYVLWAMLIAIPALVFNFSVYGSILPPYFRPGRVGSSGTFWEALAGNLVSPARGLLVYSPIFLFVIYGVVLKLKNSEFRLLDTFLLGAIFFHWLIISASREGWWAGHSYGPRLFSDVIPYLLYFLIPTIRQFAPPITVRKATVLVLFTLFAGFSFFTHFRGATEPAAAFGWNWQYGNVVQEVNNDPTRLWDWSDPQFLRGLRPAILYVEPHSLSVRVQEGHTSPRAHSLLVANLGDTDLVWQAKSPSRAHLAWAPDSQTREHVDPETVYTLPPGESTQPLGVTIDIEGYEPGVHSLGAILVSTGSDDDQPVRGSPIAIPISLEILPVTNQPTRSAPVSGYHLTFLPLMSKGYLTSELVVAPPDILVNGAAQTLAEDGIQAFYGPGWYDLEHLDAYAWRWAKSPAEIYIHSPVRRVVKLESKPVALYESGAPQGMGEHGILKVATNQEDSIEVAVQREHIFSIDLELGPGWNVVAIESLAGNVRAADLDPDSGDSRQLSFALDVVNLIEE